MKQPKIAIVGAGLAGATLANSLAARGFYDLTIIDQRGHVAGNAHTERDAETGVMVHKYGPHIFHTNDEAAWKFVSTFAEMVPYIQRTKATAGGQTYSFPINLHTINQFFCKNMRPDEARRFISDKIWMAARPMAPDNFEEYAISLLGDELYQTFIKRYTERQWGVDPRMLPASILKRLPMRFDYNDNAYSHRFQGIPRNGYTDMVAKMIEASHATLRLNTKFAAHDSLSFDHTFYSGPIDEWFGFRQGRLPYRTLDFEVIRAEGDFQGCAVMNYCDGGHWTRSTEHKHFTPWETHAKTIVYAEHPRECRDGDIPYYPIRFTKDKENLAVYEYAASRESHVTFMGRLGTYRYIDMDVTVTESLRLAKEFHRKVLRQS